MEEGSGEEEVLGSSLTMEKVAAAKQFIENHYRTQMKTIQERKERLGVGRKSPNLVFSSFPLFSLHPNGAY
ncbi:hypothetical protein CK203_072118 [Vitis vinifera]|uniref:Uncharacterized protein n=1 Tax=Vitis vinifera TaxID=29760 RepID=A0A438EXE1_VITVI|nr:hypothetical protein CK203_072118 [Vitis vinifera]